MESLAPLDALLSEVQYMHTALSTALPGKSSQPQTAKRGEDRARLTPQMLARHFDELTEALDPKDRLLSPRNPSLPKNTVSLPKFSQVFWIRRRPCSI